MYAVTDPLISMGFSVVAGGSATTVTITSGTSSITPLTNPTASSHAAFTLTDSSDPHDTASLTGLYGGFAFQALYNTSTVYSSNVASYTAGTGLSIPSSQDFSNPISGSVTNMRTQISFTVSPNDSASATTNFVLTPAPGVLALLGIGGLAVSRRRRA
jgi:hypothetical protein